MLTLAQKRSVLGRGQAQPTTLCPWDEQLCGGRSVSISTSWRTCGVWCCSGRQPVRVLWVVKGGLFLRVLRNPCRAQQHCHVQLSAKPSYPRCESIFKGKKGKMAPALQAVMCILSLQCTALCFRAHHQGTPEIPREAEFCPTRNNGKRPRFSLTY